MLDWIFRGIIIITLLLSMAGIMLTLQTRHHMTRLRQTMENQNFPGTFAQAMHKFLATPRHRDTLIRELIPTILEHSKHSYEENDQ
jgi:hypothetical protein